MKKANKGEKKEKYLKEKLKNKNKAKAIQTIKTTTIQRKVLNKEKKLEQNDIFFLYVCIFSSIVFMFFFVYMIY